MLMEHVTICGECCLHTFNRVKAVIVGGTPEGRGVVAAANYVVRKFGVHSAMAKALQLCPVAIVLRPRMEHHAQISNQIREIFHRYTPVVEPLSLDEVFLDATGWERLFGSVETIGRRLTHSFSSQTSGVRHISARIRDNAGASAVSASIPIEILDRLSPLHRPARMAKMEADGSPMLGWTPVEGATSYELWIANAPGTEPLLTLEISETSYAPANLGPGPYNVCVRAKNAHSKTAWSKPVKLDDRTVPVLRPVTDSTHTPTDVPLGTRQWTRDV